MKLPNKYRNPLNDYFPVDIDLFIEGFENSYPRGRSKVLALRNVSCNIWFNEFVELILKKIDEPSFFPICRMSDGEFLFLFGEQPIDERSSMYVRIKSTLSRLKWRLLSNGNFAAFTRGQHANYHSGEYSRDQWLFGRLKYVDWLKKIALDGIIAWHLNYELKPFGERYWPVLGDFLKENKIEINSSNYYPFYFVYALLSGLRKNELFYKKKVLIVNGFIGDKKERVIQEIYNLGANHVFWEGISSNKSLFDNVNFEKYVGKVDFILLGAGIGKPNIIYQLKCLNRVIIDAGFIFETWANPASADERPFCKLDS